MGPAKAFNMQRYKLQMLRSHDEEFETVQIYDNYHSRVVTVTNAEKRIPIDALEFYQQ